MEQWLPRTGRAPVSARRTRCGAGQGAGTARGWGPRPAASVGVPGGNTGPLWANVVRSLGSWRFVARAQSSGMCRAARRPWESGGSPGAESLTCTNGGPSAAAGTGTTGMLQAGGARTALNQAVYAGHLLELSHVSSATGPGKRMSRWLSLRASARQWVSRQGLPSSPCESILRLWRPSATTRGGGRHSVTQGPACAERAAGASCVCNTEVGIWARYHHLPHVPAPRWR